MYSYIDLTAMVLNCRLPTTWHINYIHLSWCGSLIKWPRLQLMVCSTQISRKIETGKNRNRGFLCKTEPKPNRKWNRRTVTALAVTFFYMSDALPVMQAVSVKAYIMCRWVLICWWCWFDWKSKVETFWKMAIKTER